MPNKTISLPDEVIPIIDSLDEPFSNWVRDQLLKQSDTHPKERDRWEAVEATARELAGEVDWLTLDELRAGDDSVR